VHLCTNEKAVNLDRKYKYFYDFIVCQICWMLVAFCGCVVLDGVTHDCMCWSNNTQKMHHMELVQDLVLVDKQLQHCPHLYDNNKKQAKKCVS